ncbi:hypothetical protein XPA_003256 [Xanthoria parietina]
MSLLPRFESLGTQGEPVSMLYGTASLNLFEQQHSAALVVLTTKCVQQAVSRHGIPFFRLLATACEPDIRNSYQCLSNHGMSTDMRGTYVKYPYPPDTPW